MCSDLWITPAWLIVFGKCKASTGPNHITLVAPELKILRNLQMDKNFEIDSNLFVIGAVTGKFRGILQSFCSGTRCGQLLDRG